MRPELPFNMPQNLVVPVTAVDVRLVPDTHPYLIANRAAIAANWESELAANPALYDGTVVLLSELAYREGVLEGTCHAVPYSTVLYWRKNIATNGASHAFAHAMLAASDGVLVAIRMRMDTANPGRVYFSAGAFEPKDFADGIADVDANMRREVAEETGLDLAAAVREEACHAVWTNAGTVIFRRYRLPFTGEEAARQIRDFVAADPNPEIQGPVLIRSASDLPDNLMPHMRPLIDWHFANP